MEVPISILKSSLAAAKRSLDKLISNETLSISEQKKFHFISKSISDLEKAILTLNGIEHPGNNFNKIKDLRPYLLRHPDQEMVRESCLHYLGDSIIVK